MANNSTDLIAWEKSYVGFKEGVNNANPFAAMAGFPNNQEWCDTFQSAARDQVGIRVPSGANSNNCGASLAAFQKVGRSTFYPGVGFQVFYGNGGGGHTGLVYRYDATYIYAIEGNESDQVELTQRLRTDPYVFAYGVPFFDENLDSADSAWNGKWGNPASQPPSAAPTPTTPPVAPAAPTGEPWVYLGQLEQGIAYGLNHATGDRDYCWPEVLAVEHSLNMEGLLDDRYVDGAWGTSTTTAYAGWQRRLGYTGADADGNPGIASLSKLGAKYGFRVGN